MCIRDRPQPGSHRQRPTGDGHPAEPGHQPAPPDRGHQHRQGPPAPRQRHQARPRTAADQLRCTRNPQPGTLPGPWVKTSERVLTERMAAAFTDDMIVLADRGLYSYHLWTTAMDGGAQLLWRISKTVDLPVLEQYRDGSFRSELLPSKTKAAMKAGRTPVDVDDYRIPVRVIEYT